MKGIRRGLDQNSSPRGGDLEKVCNSEPIKSLQEV